MVLWHILLHFETNSIQAGQRVMQSNFYLQHHFVSANIHPLGECFIFFLFSFNKNKIWRCFVLSFENYRLFRSRYGTIWFMIIFIAIWDKRCSSRAKNNAVKFLFATLFCECRKWFFYVCYLFKEVIRIYVCDQLFSCFFSS